jgi:hypothetical protein
LAQINLNGKYDIKTEIKSSLIFYNQSDPQSIEWLTTNDAKRQGVRLKREFGKAIIQKHRWEMHEDPPK